MICDTGSTVLATTEKECTFFWTASTKNLSQTPSQIHFSSLKYDLKIKWILKTYTTAVVKEESPGYTAIFVRAIKSSWSNPNINQNWQWILNATSSSHYTPQLLKPNSSLRENTLFLPCWKKKKNHITIQMCSFKEAFLKTSPRHTALRSSWLWQEMINNKRSLTSLEGDIILRTDIALWDRVYNNTITTITRRHRCCHHRLPPQPLAVDNPGLDIL